MAAHAETQNEKQFFLSDMIGKRVLKDTKKIGKLADLIVKENGGKFPVVTHLYVGRSFGYPPLIIEWEKVTSFSKKEVGVNIGDVADYAKDLQEEAILLKDYVLDKKVLDVEERDIDVVYDILLTMKNGKLYVCDVDFSKQRLYKRMHLRFLAKTVGEVEESKMVPWTYIQPLENLGSFKGEIKLKVLKDKLDMLGPVDLADVLEEMDNEHRVKIFDGLTEERASDTLEEINPTVQRALIASLEKKKVAQLLNVMTPGQAADILSVLPVPEAEAIMKSMVKNNVAKIQAILGQHNENVINFATQKFLSYPPNETVMKAQEDYPKDAEDKDEVMYLYVINAEGKLLGVIDIKELLKAPLKATTKLEDIMQRNFIFLKTTSTLKDASLLFARYSFRALPIVDPDGKIVGVVQYRDVMNLKHIFFE
ncbi:MAG: CBS domain-containing protein [Candidatus Bathyarchaeia archaeon]|jgi:CBS domain-containing protein/sporulation protein YlmC with PRC-barrel domain